MVARPLDILSLCAGYGGLELGIQLATGGQARCVCYVEREASCAAILVKEMAAGHLAEAPIWSDLATFDPLEWRGVVDLVTAGFPCQPASVAGARLGTSDPRWLWPLVARVIEDCAPSLVFLENVPGLRTKGLSDVLEDLAALGFDAEWGCLSAGALGSPQGRDRIWILAYRGGMRQPQREGAESDLQRWLGDECAELGDGEGAGRQGPGWREHVGTSAPLAGPSDTGASLAPWPPGQETTPHEWPADEPFPAICRAENGSAFGLGVELRNLGNGVVSVVAAYAIRALARRALGD